MKSIRKRQEAILEGHSNRVGCVAVTMDNKYIISDSGGYGNTPDKIIRI